MRLHNWQVIIFIIEGPEDLEDRCQPDLAVPSKAERANGKRQTVSGKRSVSVPFAGDAEIFEQLDRPQGQQRRFQQ